MTPTNLVYRRTAADCADGFGVLIALYDTLAVDLYRATNAERDGEIERRCREVSHALLVIGHLEEWVMRGSSGELAKELIEFYASLRQKLIEAQVNRSASMLEQQMARLLDVRARWQEMDSRSLAADSAALSSRAAHSSPNYLHTHYETRHGDWSA